MKKVLQVTGSLNMGGIEKLTANYSAYLDNEKYQLHYLVFGKDNQYFEDAVIKNGSIVHKIKYPKNKIQLYKHVRKIIRDYGPFDIVHSHILFSSGLVMKAAYKESVKNRISHSHDNLSYVKETIAEKIYHAIMRKYLIKYSTELLACSCDAGLYLYGKAFKEKNGLILKNRIQLYDYKYSPNSRKKIREKLGIKDNDLLIGTIGRVERQKNQKFVIEIMKNNKIKARGTKAIIIGDGKEKGELQKQIQEEKLSNTIYLLGTKSNVSDYLSAMDVFILPSIHEGLGIVLIEAQANGLPCIAPEKIVPDETKVLDSFIFIPIEKSNDSDEWSRKILKANRQSSDKAIKKIINAGYGIDGLHEDLIKIYEGKKTQC